MKDNIIFITCVQIIISIVLDYLKITSTSIFTAFIPFNALIFYYLVDKENKS